MHRADDILEILDRCSDEYTFPMLDNGYAYLAATRLSLFRSPNDWAIAIEVFGFSPRVGIPDLSVSTFASTLTARDQPSGYATPEAYQNYLRTRPHNEFRSFYPVDAGSWQDEDDSEVVSSKRGAELVLRGRTLLLPSPGEYARHGIELEDPDEVRVYELSRYLAAIARNDVLATVTERRVSVAPNMEQLLVLDDWHHPDLVNGERPSQLDSFRQLARVLETGDAGAYRPTEPGNTHWKNWPDGGEL